MERVFAIGMAFALGFTSCYFFQAQEMIRGATVAYGSVECSEQAVELQECNQNLVQYATLVNPEPIRKRKR